MEDCATGPGGFRTNLENMEEKGNGKLQNNCVFKYHFGGGEMAQWVKVLAVQTGRPEFKSPQPLSKPDTLVHKDIPSTRAARWDARVGELLGSSWAS